jgi:opacity protein-like surface antigen
MKKTLLSIALAVLCASTSFAQKTNRHGAFGALTIGYSPFGNQKFYDEMVKGKSRNLFPEPEKAAMSIGGEGYSVFNSIILGGELTAYASNKASQSYTNPTALADRDKDYTLDTRRMGASVMLNMGYIVFHKQNWIIYPLGGIGYGGSAYTLSDPRSGSFTEGRSYPFSNKIEEKNALIYNTSLAFNAGLGVNYFVTNSNGNAKGFSVGVRFGYYQMSPKGKYIVNEEKMVPLAGTPLGKTANNGWYVRLLIGGGKIKIED